MPLTVGNALYPYVPPVLLCLPLFPFEGPIFRFVFKKIRLLYLVQILSKHPAYVYENGTI